MIEVPVYIPREGEHLGAKIAARSAIVGPAEPRMSFDAIVYYEGNLYGASNMITFADRAMFAYWRMRDHYPTVARLAVSRHRLRRVATLYPEHGRVEPKDGRQLFHLAQWLEIPLEESERLASELRCAGVERPSA